MPLLQRETICDLQRLHEFEGEWNGLFAKVPHASPFQSPLWLITWWKHFARGELRVLVLRDGEEVVAVFPLYIETKPCGQRELKCIGAGISDYLEPLVMESYESSAYEHCFDWLRETSADWDKCMLEGLTNKSPLLNLSNELGGAIGSEPCLVAQLPGSIDEWRRSVSHHLRENISYCWRRAERSAPLTLREATDKNLPRFVEMFFALHKARWVATEKTVAKPVEAFYREIAARLSGAGLLRVYILYWGDDAVSAIYGFRHQRTFYIYLTAFDPQFAKHSFGTLVINGAIERAIEDGCTSVDFLRGREEYKYHFGVKEKQMATFSCDAQEARRFCERYGTALLFR